MNMNAFDLPAVPLLDRLGPDARTLSRMVIKNLGIDCISYDLDCGVLAAIGGGLKLSREAILASLAGRPR
jgi:hypothetical protein